MGEQVEGFFFLLLELRDTRRYFNLRTISLQVVICVYTRQRIPFSLWSPVSDELKLHFAINLSLVVIDMSLKGIVLSRTRVIPIDSYVVVLQRSGCTSVVRTLLNGLWPSKILSLPSELFRISRKDSLDLIQSKQLTLEITAAIKKL